MSGRRAAVDEYAGWLLAAVLAWLVAYPLLLTVTDALWPSAGLDLAPLRETLGSGRDWRALWGSLWISLATVAAAAAVGIPLAWWVRTTALPGGRWLEPMLALPIALPPLVGTLTFLVLFGESGFLGHAARAVTGADEAPWRLEGWFPVLLVHAYGTYPVFYLFTRAALGTLDASLLEAAAGLGAGRWRTWRRVIAPALAPAWAGAALLTFMTSLGSFSAPYIFGGGFRVMTTQIVLTRLNGDDAHAAMQTALLAGVALLALVAFGRADPPEAGAGSGRATRPLGRRRPVRRWLAGAAAWGVAAVLLAPLAALALMSLVPAGSWSTEAFPPVLRAANYAVLVHDPVRLGPLVTSTWMALLAVGVALVLAVAVAGLAVRARVRARGLLLGLAALPWAVPGTVFAVALATAFSVDRPAALRLVLVGTPWLLPLAYLVRVLPLVSRAVTAQLRRLDPAFDEAAAALGAGRARRWARVTLPLVRPALVAGGSLAFVTAFGDFVTSIVLYSYHTRPVSLEIMASLRQADVGVAAAYGVLLTAIASVVFWQTREEAS